MRSNTQIQELRGNQVELAQAGREAGLEWGVAPHQTALAKVAQVVLDQPRLVRIQACAMLNQTDLDERGEVPPLVGRHGRLTARGLTRSRQVNELSVRVGALLKGFPVLVELVRAALGSPILDLDPHDALAAIVKDEVEEADAGDMLLRPQRERVGGHAGSKPQHLVRERPGQVGYPT